MIYFTPDDHKYHDLVPSATPTDWISGTKVVGHFKKPFDPRPAAEKASKNRKSKWHKMSVANILAAWEMESVRSTTLGNYYHKLMEDRLLAKAKVPRVCGIGSELLNVVEPVYTTEGYKRSPFQMLAPGCYPEHLVYLDMLGVCGQSDRVDVSETGFVDIIDYKTSKEIKETGFIAWNGERSTMNGLLSHLDDCNYNHYSLQLSLYLYIILRHNPQLKPGVLRLEHVVFELMPYTDPNGYPIQRLDKDHNPIVKDVIPYYLPYLEMEVMCMLDQLDSIRTSSKSMAYA